MGERRSDRYESVTRRVVRRRTDGALGVRVVGWCPRDGRHVDELVWLPGASEGEVIALRDRAYADLQVGAYSPERLLGGQVPTLAAFTETLIAERTRVRKPRTIRADRYYAASWLSHPIGQLRLCDIEFDDVRRWAEAQFADDCSVNTARRRILQLQMFLQAALDRGYRPRGDNPARAVILPAKQHRRPVPPPDEDELGRLFAVLRRIDAEAGQRSEHGPWQADYYVGVFPYFALMMMWARRGDEMLSLEWTDVGRDVVIWADTKTNEPVAVPLPAAQRALLDEHRESQLERGMPAQKESAYVWPTIDGTRHDHTGSFARKVWLRARDEAGLDPRLRAHDLRSVGASYIIEHSGETAARATTGHKGSAFELYARARWKTKQEAMERQAALFNSITGGQDDEPET